MTDIHEILSRYCNVDNSQVHPDTEAVVPTNKLRAIESAWEARKARAAKTATKSAKDIDVRFKAEAFGLDYTTQNPKVSYMAVSRVLNDDGKLFGFLVIRLPDFKIMGTLPLNSCLSGQYTVSNMLVSDDGVVPLHGAMASYPAISKLDGTGISTRALVVLGEAIIRNSDVMKMRWDKKGSSYFVNDKEDKKVFFISDAFGNISCVSMADVIHLDANYTFANAQMYHSTLHSKNSCSPAIESFLPRLFAFKQPDKLRENTKKLATRYSAKWKNTGTVQEGYHVLTAKEKSKIVYLLDIVDMYHSFAGDIPYYQIEMYCSGDKSQVSARPALPASKEQDAFNAAYLCDTINITPSQMSYIETEGSKARFSDILPKNTVATLINIYDNISLSREAAIKYMHIEDAPLAASTSLANLLNKCEPCERVNQLRIYNNLPKDLRSYYDLCIRNEARITNHVQSLARELGGTLKGLDYRIKMPASYAEKMLERSRLSGGDEKNELRWARDIVRYTIVFSEEEYVNAIKKVMLAQYLEANMPKRNRDFKQRTWVVFEIRNYWTVNTNPYNGTNTAFALFGSSEHNIEDEETDIYSRKGINFDVRYEIQFHTEKSLAVKEGEMHKLYEQYRAPGGTVEEKQEIQNRMFDLAFSTPKPIHISKLTPSDIVKTGWDARERSPVDLEAPRRDSKEFANYDANKALAKKYGDVAGEMLKK